MRDVPTFPEIPLDKLRVGACLDYVKLKFEVCLSEGIPEDNKHQWTRLEDGTGWVLTLHDPDPKELARLDHDLGDEAVLYGFELSVDFWPSDKVAGDEKESLLKTAFASLAPRFRPDDELMFGVGMKGGFGSSKPIPIDSRLPSPNETLVYSHRDEGHQAKLYLKTRDQGQALPVGEQRVRLETTLTRYAAMAYRWHDPPAEPFDRLRDLATNGLRRRFAKVFRIIDRPELRDPNRFDRAKREDLERTMWAAWQRAGVNAFAGPDLHPDALPKAKVSRNKRETYNDHLPQSLYRLRRDVATNKKIGNALYVLDRRLQRSFSHL